MKKLIAILALMALFCSGCRRQEPVSTQPVHRVVTGIDITYQNGPLFAKRSYTNNKKMEVILHYLRFIDPYGTPQEIPEQVKGSEFHILLTYSDGSKRLYRQRADRYLMKDGNWKCIDPKKAQELSRILSQMESDI